ncbi:hypothetical protein SDC9_23934 [bioreactor metagenome]|uniref:Uncharacterized protein n=1 Tax=bioreactor metagenome TaxID=1076179 RepID=A0A644UGW4_9ZZZZ|nr:hypothetical protein [Methanobrevibacter sp.]MEA4957181.1 hypothetical protein [Methanobrevibacter sp.]
MKIKIIIIIIKIIIIVRAIVIIIAIVIINNNINNKKVDLDDTEHECFQIVNEILIKDKLQSTDDLILAKH